MNNVRKLYISVKAWEAFISAHGNECDLSSLLDEMIQTLTNLRQEFSKGE